jgi:hypothetical protein
MKSPFRPDDVPGASALETHRPLLRSLERRGLIRGGISLGALVMLAGCDVNRPESVEVALLAISRFNDKVQALLFDPDKLAPTYPASMILRPPKFNAYYDVMDVKPVNDANWRLELSGLVSDKHPWTLQELDALPQHSMVIRHICVEGMELHRWLDRGAVSHIPRARRRRPPRQVRRLQNRRRLSEQHRHGDRAASADIARNQVRR